MAIIPERSSVRKILVIRLDRVGDLILSTPFLRNLHESFDRAEITAMVTPYTAEVLVDNPSVAHILTYDRTKSWKERHAFIRDLSSGSWDMAFALSPVASAYWMAFLSKSPARYGYVYSGRMASRVLAPLLLTGVNVVTIDEALRKGERIPHEVEQTFVLLRSLGIDPGEYPLELFPGDEARRAAASEIEPWAGGRTIIGIHLSEKWFTGGWETPHFLGLLDALLAAHKNSSLLVTYGSMERERARMVREAAVSNERVRLIGDLSFRVWAALIGCCACYISPDTGALHCATAMKIPVLAVYESSTFLHCSQQWAPWKVHTIIVRKDIPEKTIMELRDGTITIL